MRYGAWLAAAWGYAAAAGLVMATWGVRLTLDPLIGNGTPFLNLFFLPIVAAAWFFGLGPALLAVALSQLVGDLQLYNDALPFSGRVLRAGIFVMVSILVVAVIDSRRRVEVVSKRLLAFPDELPERLERYRRQKQFWSGWTWLVPVGVIAALFTLYEALKEVLSPELTKWESHIMSIVVVTIIAAVVLYRSRSVIQVQLETIGLIAQRLQERDTEARKLALVASRTSNGVVITDAQGQVEWVNDGFTRITGYTLAELAGKRPGDMLEGPDSDPAVIEQMRNAVAAGRGFDVDVLNYGKNGRKYWVNIQVEPITNSSGAVTNFIAIETDITEKKEMWEAIRASERRSRMIIDTALDAVLLVDGTGLIVGANPQLERIFGQERRLIVHRPFAPLLIAAEARAQVIDTMRGLAVAEEGQAMARMETRGLRADGTAFEAEVSISALPCGGAGGYSIFVRDISERKRFECELREARDTAEAANEAKSAFLATMSHEMRTPLNGVIASLGLVLDGKMPEADRRLLNLARSSADTLLVLINQVLDFSKVEAGKLDLELADFDLHTAVEDVVEMMTPRAQQKGLWLHCRMDPATPAHVRGDALRLRQVLLNLVNNAIKFTEKGHVIVRTELVEDAGGTVTVRMSVEDTGIGIPEAGMARLFKSFSQVDTSMARKYGGTGLGLAISKQLVELMGGHIAVSSQEGKGSTFSFTAQLQRQAYAAARELVVGGRDLNVLVVDALQPQRDATVDQLRAWGFRVRTAADRREAQAMLQGHMAGIRPQVVVLDAETTGALEDLASWLARVGPVRVPLIVTAPLGWQADLSGVNGAALVQVLSKPVRRSALFDAIMNAATGRHAQPEAPQEVLPASVATTGARVLLAEDNAVNQIVAQELLTRLGYACVVAVNGRAAVQAVQNEAFDAVLMDCQMPEMDGFEATREIRRLEAAGNLKQHARLPIVALTANAVRGDRERCLAAGMDAYLTKPIDPAALAATLRNAVTDRSSPSTHQPADAQDPIDAAALITRCMGDAGLASRLLEAFRRQAVEQLASLTAAVRAGDAAATASIAHGLKGSAANLAAERVRALAAEIEAAGKAATLEGMTLRVEALRQEVDACLAYGPLVVAEARIRR